MIPKIRPDLTIQQVGDESLVLDLETEQIHQLNTTAAWILAQCTGENSIECIIRSFAKEFRLDSKTATSDVAATLDQLEQEKVIVFDSTP